MEYSFGNESDWRREAVGQGAGSSGFNIDCLSNKRRS